LREIAKELEKYPNVELVDVSDTRDHVRIAMEDGRLRIDAVSEDGDVVHVSMPARVLRDVTDELEEKAPGV
jgi:division protein CdvB (Snf7/Vps24/ESCRT-III family)